MSQFATYGFETNSWFETNVFVSGEGGYHTYRIPALAVTRKGTVLAFCEGRKYSAADSGKIDLLLKRSSDGGHSWSACQIVASDAQNVCGNPSPVVDQDTGTVWLLWTWNSGHDTEREIEGGTSKDTRRVFVTSSADDGVTWTKPLEITGSVKRPDWRWYATGPGNGIQLSRGSHKGRLVVPCNHSEPQGLGFVSRSHVIFSDDHGKTWRLGGSAAPGSNESTVAELDDGSILQNARSPRGKHLRGTAVSHDAGASWSGFHYDATLVEPGCEGSMVRCSWPSDGKPGWILFSNPASTRRERLTLRGSDDEGATWSRKKEICRGPSAYSSLALLPTNEIACLFECGKQSPYEAIKLVVLPFASLKSPAH
ncbi:MAG TPA: sialidase family protein [Verrucomicrobiae bacterium]|nr:sialidase family protein [Verrucomicrobiae bacterium]